MITIGGVRHLIFDGQSFSFAPTIVDAFPTRMINDLPDAHWTWDRVAIGATTYAQRSATAALRVDTRIPNNRPTVLIDCAGMSDIISAAGGGGDLTAAQLLTAAESYWTARRAAGVDIIVATTIPPATAAWYDADANTQRTTYNTNVQASAGPDAVADIAGLANASNASNTTYYYDGLHPTAALAQDFATAIIAELAALGLPT